MRYIRAGHNLYGTPARYYLLRAMRHRDEGLMMFNDCCRDFDELRNLISNARERAVADIVKARVGLAAEPPDASGAGKLSPCRRARAATLP